MNNSLKRMIEGMATTLRNEVIPHVGTEFARGQAFGVIYMLNSIGLRASWSRAFLGEQIAAQMALRDALIPMINELDAPPLPQQDSVGGDAAALETLRDENEARICAIVEWQGRALLAAPLDAAIEQALRTYMDRQLKHELQTSAKPMFAEMSSGSE